MFPFFHRLLRHFVTTLGIVSLGISGNDDCRVCFFPGLPTPSFEHLFLPYIIVHFLNFVLPYLRFTCICASHITSLTSRCIAYERNGHMNRKQGFTLAELLIVVAIIGVLVAVSVPIFTAQRRKAVDAVNRANIRAAKSMALAAFYDDKTVYVESRNGTKMAYFKYTDGSLVRLDTELRSDQVNSLARTVCDQAAHHKRCDCIYVYVSLNDAKPIQTAPYLDQNGNIRGDDKGQFG